MTKPFNKVREARNASRGFTLLEIILVVFIVGIMATGITIVASRDEIPQVIRDEAGLLQQDIRELQNLAMIHHRLYGLSFTQAGWRPVEIQPDVDYLTWGIDQATVVSDDEEIDETKPLPWQPVINVDTHGLDSRIEMLMYLDEDNQVELLEKDLLVPQIIISAQGDVTPFVLVLRGERAESGSVYQITPAGLVRESDENTQSYL
ncbi:MAG: prepilin-type N-terminal cleavage/methylation domain-containing protein [Pseudomonadota bacterium]|nr:hypothetical protein [Gammaproteobacteria bacterium]MEC8012545.1 prepilin-type N-terminal cleavage/methylation domain-containing protein [Pseudomonadota bacterium]HBF09893.1 hypothetical protein [Gammaproteobacteria bacterium]